MKIKSRRAHMLGAGVVALCAGLVAASASSAADLPYRKAPPVVPPAPVFTWTGFYVGVSAGGIYSQDKWTTTGLFLPPVAGVVPDATASTNLNATAFRIGGYAGYNYQFDTTYVVGVEADFAGDIGGKKSVAGIPGTTGANGIVAPFADSVSGEPQFDGSVRARLGYLVTPSILLYATGGVAFQDTKYSVNCPGAAAAAGLNSWCTGPAAGFAADVGTSEKTRVGWTVGGGIEGQIWGNWIARAEYRYSDYGNNTSTFFAGSRPGQPALAAGADAIVAKNNLQTHVFNVGLAYKF